MHWSNRSAVLGSALALLAACGEGTKAPVAPERLEPRLPLTSVARQNLISQSVVPGNPSCPAGTYELKIEPVGDGTYTGQFGFSVTIDVRETGDGPVFDFTSNKGVDAVIVKGGPNANVYDYNPEVTSGTGLHAPVNPSNGNYYGLSHISFCYDLEPKVEIEKTGDALSKIGDAVTYQFVIRNTGDFPLTLTSIVDDKIGSLLAEATAAGCGTLAVGGQCSFSRGFTIPAGAPDPFVNTVTATYGSAGGTVSSTDTHSTNLFQPSITLAKTGDYYSKIGDVIKYTITLANTSSNDSPALICTVQDATAGVNKSVTLASGASDVTNATHTVVVGDPDPLVNTASVNCSPDGFPNVLTQTATWTTDLLQPAYTITKECVTDPVPAGQPATFRVTLSNTGTADLVFAVTDDAMPSINGTQTIPVGGAPVVLTGTIAVPAGASSVANEVKVVITLDERYKLDNTYTESRTATCQVPNEPPPGNQGCTPGYWKQPQHLDSWIGYTPDQTVGSVFSVGGALGSMTLLEALDVSGGGGNTLTGASRTLLRAAVAALLNASSNGVNYPISTAKIISDVNEALASGDRKTILTLAGTLDGYNNLGCPLD
jgi:hypothetical protein